MGMPFKLTRHHYYSDQMHIGVNWLTLKANKRTLADQEWAAPVDPFETPTKRSHLIEMVQLFHMIIEEVQARPILIINLKGKFKQ